MLEPRLFCSHTEKGYFVKMSMNMKPHIRGLFLLQKSVIYKLRVHNVKLIPKSS